MKKAFFLFFFTCLFSNAFALYFFKPPKGWKCANPKILSPSVEVGFFTKGKTAFHPSINLATEKTKLSLKEYLQVVKKMHVADRNNKLRDLGSIQIKAGKAHLYEITTKTNWGEIKMLQAILVENETAFVLTAALHQKDFAQKYSTILESFQSFQFINDFFSPIENPEKRKILQSQYEALTHAKEKKKKAQFKKFQKLVVQDPSELGQHWQFIVLKDALEYL